MTHRLNKVHPWLACAALILLAGGSGTLASAAPTVACSGLLGGTAIAHRCETWTHLVDNGEDYASGIATSPDGSILYVSSVGSAATGHNTADLRAISSATGTTIWESRWEPRPGAAVSGPQSITVSPDGEHVYVTGGVWIGTDPQAYAHSYAAADGRLEWVYLGPGPSAGNALTLSPDMGTVYVTGSIVQFHNRFTLDFLTLAIDARMGRELWAATYSGGGGATAGWRPDYGWDEGSDLAVSPDGGTLFVTGISASPGGVLEQATLAYDAHSGDPLWLHRFHAQDLLGRPVATEGYAVAAHEDRVFVFGTAGLQALDAATGAALWAEPRNAVTCRPMYSWMSESECSLAVDQSTDTVFALTFNNVAAFDGNDGDALWRFPLTLGEHTSTGTRAMTFNRDGTRLYVAGPGGKEKVTNDHSGIDANLEALALDARGGQLLWRAVYDSGEREATAGIALHPDGSAVYVVGTLRYRTNPGDAVVTVAFPTQLGLENAP